MIGRPWPTLVLVGLMGSTGAGCDVCTSTSECAGGDVCFEGACVPSPPPRVSILSPRAPVGATYEVSLELGFRGGEAIVTLERAGSDPGEPCLPFPPIIRRVAGDVDNYVTRVILIPGLPALGESFTLVALVEVNGTTISASQPIIGPPPPPDVGGLEITSPSRVAVDVLRDPLTRVEVDAPSPPVAFVEPTTPLAASGVRPLPTPRIALVPAGDGWVGEVPALRGPHIVWVEAIVDGVTKRCGHGLIGGPDEIADDEVEVLLLSRSLEGDEHHIELMTRVGDAFCDGRIESPVPCRAHVAATPGPVGRDGLVLSLDDGLIEMAAIPRQVSRPVDVQIRVARGDRHIALFGPITLQPALGETWLGGHIRLADGEVDGVFESLAPPARGSPWR